MSVQHVLDFYDRLANDPDLLDVLVRAPDRDARLQLAAAQGFIFDEHDFEAGTEQFLDTVQVAAGPSDAVMQDRVGAVGLSLLGVITQIVAPHYDPAPFFSKPSALLPAGLERASDWPGPRTD